MTAAIAAILVFLFGWLFASTNNGRSNKSYEDQVNDNYSHISEDPHSGTL